MYELQADWANTISNAITNGNKPKDIEENQFNFADLDRNRDGKIDLITVIYKNTTQKYFGWLEFTSLGLSLIFKYDFSTRRELILIRAGEYLQLTCNYENVNGLVLYRSEDNLPILPTGKICHETMHALGLKDLYRSNQTSAVYYMSLMAKHLTPIGQYISVKERESLGWLDNNQIKTIDKNGTYTLYPASAQNEVVAYKRDLPNGKTLYLEYRQFDDNGNKYDTKNKKLYSCNTGDLIKGVTLKSGLICYLANTGVRFPSNINTTGANWNMQVVSNGQYSTMSDCAVGDGEELYIDNDIFVYVTNMSADKLEFEISGIAETTPYSDFDSDFYSDSYYKSHSNRESESYSESHSYCDSTSYSYNESDSYSDNNSDHESDSYSTSDPDNNSDSNAYCNSDSESDTNSDFYPKTYTTSDCDYKSDNNSCNKPNCYNVSYT